ncbi:MAG: DUF7210 family protein [bacterium]
MSLERVVRVRLLQPLTYKGLDLVPGTEIQVPEGRAAWLEERGLAEKLEILIVEPPPEDTEPEEAPEEPEGDLFDEDSEGEETE